MYIGKKYLIKVNTIDGLRYVGRQRRLMIDKADAIPFIDYGECLAVFARLSPLVREIVQL